MMMMMMTNFDALTLYPKNVIEPPSMRYFFTSAAWLICYWEKSN